MVTNKNEMNVRINIDPQVVNAEKLGQALVKLKAMNVLLDGNEIVCEQEKDAQVKEIIDSIIK